jgi:hypothetical protein
MDDGHLLTFATIFGGLILFGVLVVGGTILYLTFSHWREKNHKEISTTDESRGQ